MVKFRSMTVGADRTGVDSSSADDPRITRVGRVIRAYKLDELVQLWNVLCGDMSLVGPRPQVARDAAIYTDVERELLAVRPGITDLSSIVFSDEGEILKGAVDPDLAYNQLIRPWKSRLGLIYVEHAGLRLDLECLVLTAAALVSRDRALAGVDRVLARLGADGEIRRAAARRQPLTPFPPPGSSAVVMQR
jgi:lipopolysaccharide/colanic/teichoic acid biosynthesis glycosyltransferase